jgi:hypothetical protein
VSDVRHVGHEEALGPRAGQGGHCDTEVLDGLLSDKAELDRIRNW